MPGLSASRHAPAGRGGGGGSGAGQQQGTTTEEPDPDPDGYGGLDSEGDTTMRDADGTPAVWTTAMLRKAEIAGKAFFDHPEKSPAPVALTPPPPPPPEPPAKASHWRYLLIYINGPRHGPPPEVECTFCFEPITPNMGQIPQQSPPASGQGSASGPASRAPGSEPAPAPHDRGEKLTCGHMFGHSCITKWIKSSDRGGASTEIRCPICRDVLGRSQRQAFFRLWTL